MAAQGYSQNRAPVSGPGSFSARTDQGPGQPIRNLPNAGYGEAKDFREIQQGADMAKARPMPRVTRLDAPTERPDEPITSGANLGPGPDRSILGMPTPADTQLADLGKLGQYLPIMEMYANSPQSSGTMKSFVKYLRSQI